jgi:hypothetical protein
VEAATIVPLRLTKLQMMQQVAAEPVVHQVLLELVELLAHLALQVHLALLELVELLALWVQVVAVVAVAQAAVVGKPSKSCCFIATQKKYANDWRIFLSTTASMLFVVCF